MWTTILAIGAVLTVASPWIPHLEQWGPLLLLWTAGGAHLAMIVARERRNAARHDNRQAGRLTTTASRP